MTTKKRPFLLFFFLILISLIGNAQDKEVSYVNKQWFQYNTQFEFSEKWTMITNVGYRLKDGFKQRSQYIGRIGVGYELNPNMRLTVGLTHLGSYASEKLGKLEFRPYQELTLSQEYKNIEIGHRVRVEQRYFKTINQENDQNKSSFNFRFTYRFLLKIPVMKLSESNPDKILLLNIGNEIFINAGNRIVYNTFDQNRIILGSVIEFNDTLAMSLRYYHQFKFLNSPSTYEQNYIFVLGIKQTINLRNL